MHEDKFRSLAKKYIQNQCSEDEVKMFFDYISKGKYDKVLREEIDRIAFDPVNGYPDLSRHAFEKIFERISKTAKLKDQ